MNCYERTKESPRWRRLPDSVEAMRVLQMDPLGGAGKEVEADETFIGQKRPKKPGARGYAPKHAVVSLSVGVTAPFVVAKNALYSRNRKL